MHPIDEQMIAAVEFDAFLEERSPLGCKCGHSQKDHACKGPKKPHSASALSSKQLAASIEWKNYPERNGPYVLYPTTQNAYCEVALCTCIDFERKS